MTIESILVDILVEIRAVRVLSEVAAGVTAGHVPLPQSPAPTVQPVLPVPSTVGVAPTPTAPVVPLDTSPDPTAVFGQNAPMPESVVPTAAPLTASPAPVGNSELDAKGLPWDGRIHASSKAKIADGSWRQKRGVDQDLVKTVEAEMRQVLAAPAAPGEPWVPPAMAAQPWPFPESGAAVPPPPPVAPMTHPQLALKLMQRITAGTLTAEAVEAACQKFGVPSFPALALRMDLLPAVAQELQA